MKKRTWAYHIFLWLIGFTLVCVGCDQETVLVIELEDAWGLQEVSLSSDTIVLEPGLLDASGTPSSPEDARSENDYQDFSDISLPEEDAFSEGPISVDVSEDFSDMPCEEGGMACPPEQICQHTQEGPQCISVDVCSSDHAYTQEEVLALSQEWDHFYTKVLALIQMEGPSCTPMICNTDEPCCNHCFANLQFGSAERMITILGMQESIGCEGSECDYQDHCTPMKPGVWYYLLGTIERQGYDFRMKLDSFCPTGDF